MPYFGSNHLVDEEFSAGPRVGFFEAVSQGYEQQYRVDSPYSLEAEIEDRWEQSLLELERMTGQATNLPGGLGAYQYYARSVLGQDQTFFAKSFDGEVAPDVQQQIASFAKVNEQIKQLKNPNIRSFEEVLDEALKAQRAVEARTADVSERGDITSTIGQFIGAVGGSFSTRDPVNLATLGIGGFGRSVAMRIATEMGIAGSLTAATDIGAVSANRELAGLPERDILFDVAAAAVGAGVIRGGFEGLSKLAERFTARAPEGIAFDFDDGQLRQMFAVADTPNTRAGDLILDDVQALERANPYGEGPAAEARFFAELQDVQRVLGGAPETAIARVLPPLPEEYISKQADFQLVRDQAPEVYARFTEAQAAVRAIDEEIEGINAALSATTLPDAVRLVDEQAAATLDELSAVVNDLTLPEPVRQAADLRAQNIITAVGEERIAKALNDAEIAPRKQVQRLRASRRSANRKLRDATRAVEVKRDEIRARQAFFENLQQRQSVDILGNAMNGRSFVGPSLRHENVGRLVDEVVERVERAPEADVARIAIEPDENGLVDIGLSARVPADFRVPTDDGEFSIADILADLRDDKALEEAVKACAI